MSTAATFSCARSIIGVMAYRHSDTVLVGRSRRNRAHSAQSVTRPVGCLDHGSPQSVQEPSDPV
jgi:hypothetical protein